MSIAVSAFVRPSRTARHLLLIWSLAHGAVAIAIAAAPLPLRLGEPSWLAAILAGAGLVLAWTAARTPKTRRIDISGTGELRVTVQQDVCTPRPDPCSAGGAGEAPAPLALLPGSRSWPGLMLLRLGAAHGRPHVLAIWRDSVDGEAWRALAVALGVIGSPRAPGRMQDESMNSLQQAPSRARRRSQRDHVQ
jgi:hypothetical protein